MIVFSQNDDVHYKEYDIVHVDEYHKNKFLIGHYAMELNEEFDWE
jgi:hypothetical protein